MQHLSQEFLEICRIRRLQPTSIRIYREHLVRFLDWLAAEHATCPPPSAITTELALRFLASKPHWSPAYSRQFLAALRTCLAYGQRIGRAVGHVEIQTLKAARQLPRVFTEAETGRLLETLDQATDVFARRDRALVAVLYYGGLRTAEVCALDVTAVDVDGRLVLVDGKGRRQRLVPLPPEAIPPLRAHLAGHPGGRILFHTRTGARLTRKAIVLALERRTHAAGIQGRVHPHAFRHSRATHLLDHGMTLEHVSEFLGHADLRTTMLYRHLSRARLRQTIDLHGCLTA